MASLLLITVFYCNIRYSDKIINNLSLDSHEYEYTELNDSFTYILTLKVFLIRKMVLTLYDVRQRNCAS